MKSKILILTTSNLYVQECYKSLNYEEFTLIHFAPNPIVIEHSNYFFYQRDVYNKDGVTIDQVLLVLKNAKINLDDFKCIIGASEPTIFVAAMLRTKAGIPGQKPDEIAKFINKDLMKLSIQNKVKTAEYSVLDKYNMSYYELQTKLNSDEFIIKPLEGHSGIATYHIHNEVEFNHIYSNIKSLDDEFLVERFIDGTLFHCDFIVQNGEVKFYACGKYNLPLLEYTNGAYLYTQPVLPDDINYAAAKLFSEQALMALNGNNGSFHMEIFLDSGTNKWYFLECGARLPGDAIIMMHNITYGCNLCALDIQVQLMQDIKLQNLSVVTPAAVIGCPKQKGTIVSYSLPNNLPCQIIPLFQLDTGSTVEAAKSFNDISFAALVVSQDINSLQYSLNEITDFKLVIYTE